jgi:cell division protein FtsL
MRRRASGVILAALGLAALLGALSLVTWRQARALEARAEVEHLEREISLVRAERAELQRRMLILEGRDHVVRAARERLGLRSPQDQEIVLLAGEDR